MLWAAAIHQKALVTNAAGNINIPNAIPDGHLVTEIVLSITVADIL